MFHDVSRQDFIFYQSPGVAPGRNRRDARASDANQAILAEDADQQLGMVRGWKNFVKNSFEVPGGGDVCLLNELGNWWGKKKIPWQFLKLLGVQLTW